MTDKELLDKIKSREELEKRGFKRLTCPHCKGTRVPIGYGHRNICFACDGKGYTWSSPLMRCGNTY